MLNNIDLEGLDAAKTGIMEEPDNGIAQYGVNIQWRNGVCARASTMDMQVGADRIARDYDWIIDEPPQLLGASQGPTPQEYLMSGVGACIMVGFVVNASVRGVKINSLDVEVKGSLDLAGFLNLREDAQVPLAGLQYTIKVDAETDDETLSAIAQDAVKFSPNAMSMTHQVPLVGEIRRA